LVDRGDRLSDRKDRFFDRAQRFRDNRFVNNRFVRQRIFFVRHNFFVGFDFASFGWPWWGWGGWSYPPYDGYYPYYDDYYPYYDDPPTYGSQYDTEYWKNLAMSVQTKLAEQGYYRGQIDGIIGSGSLQAIRQFQSDYGLAVNGKIDPKLLNALGIDYKTQTQVF
jgi:Putative peptidoglycan binding domain